MLFKLVVIACYLMAAISSARRAVMAYSDHPIVMVVSFDGFRSDYMGKIDTPNFDSIAATGVRAKWIQPSFPSLTFPNHHSIATGLYPESHGITANSFYDPALDDIFYMNSTESKWWDTGSTPLYILNEMAGDGRHSATMMWLGSSSSYFNRSATHVIGYNSSVSWSERVDGVLEWLTDEQKPANSVFLYFEEPDKHGHMFGPDSEEVRQQIARADNITGYLISRLQDAGLYDTMDLIVTSDHGMAHIPHENNHNLAAVVNPDYYRDFNGSPLINILPRPGFENIVYEAFKNASIADHFDIYWREEIPEAYHYRDNARISPIVIITQENYTVELTHQEVPMVGQHGFNNSLPTMRAFFLAHGPSFKVDYVAEPFRNVDIYPLVSHLLGLQAAPNNGSFDEVKDLLRMPSVILQRILQNNIKEHRRRHQGNELQD